MITEVFDKATDAFNEAGHGSPAYGAGIDTDDDWTTQLTKGCKLFRANDDIDGEGHHTATIELCFDAIERSLKAFALAKGGDDFRDFHEHTHSYDRAAALGLLSLLITERLERLYTENRTDSYYGGKRHTEGQASAMQSLACAIHDTLHTRFFIGRDYRANQKELVPSAARQRVRQSYAQSRLAGRSLRTTQKGGHGRGN